MFYVRISNLAQQAAQEWQQLAGCLLVLRLRGVPIGSVAKFGILHVEFEVIHVESLLVKLGIHFFKGGYLQLLGRFAQHLAREQHYLGFGLHLGQVLDKLFVGALVELYVVTLGARFTHITSGRKREKSHSWVES